MIVSLLLAALVVIVPHGDDEVTLLPLIQNTDNVTVVIMTDGAATSRCGSATYLECEQRRYESTKAFLEETAPNAKLMWIGEPDGMLQSNKVALVASNVCPGCEIVAAGSDYGHPDHDAVRDGVEEIGGWAYDGSLREDEQALRSVKKYYGWLVQPDQYGILGLK